jgi:hypothetical protein
MAKHFFVTYGDIKYQQAKQRLAAEAAAFGFDEIKAYSRGDLPQSFLATTSPWINHNQGGGYWLWKPFLLKETFNKMAWGDVLVYMDAGCQLNNNGKQRYNEYVAQAQLNTGSLAFEMAGKTEAAYCSDEVFNHFHLTADHQFGQQDQLSATCFLLIKNPFTQSLIDEFYTIATARPQLFSNDFNAKTTRTNFIAHRHDQSILSLLRKQKGSHLITDECWAPDFDTLHDKPFWAKRIKDKKSLLTRFLVLIGKR